MVGLTLLLYRFIGHWGVLVPVRLGDIGTAFHFVWCRRNGIDAVRATRALNARSRPSIPHTVEGSRTPRRASFYGDGDRLADRSRLAAGRDRRGQRDGDRVGARD